jgi:hypothetical protein
MGPHDLSEAFFVEGGKTEVPIKVEARRNECCNGLLFPPERSQNNNGPREGKNYF